MNNELMVVGLAAVLLAVGTDDANAQGRSGGAGDNANQRPVAGQQDGMDTTRQQDEMRRQEAEAKRAEAEAQNRSEEYRAEHEPDEHAADEADAAEGNKGGSDTAATMQERRDERKAIKEEYRGAREAGQEGADPDDDEDIAEDQKAKAKKPWWKFWGD